MSSWKIVLSVGLLICWLAPAASAVPIENPHSRGGGPPITIDVPHFPLIDFELLERLRERDLPNHGSAGVGVVGGSDSDSDSGTSLQSQSFHLATCGRDCSDDGTPGIPEPTAALLFASGFSVVAYRRRHVQH